MSINIAIVGLGYVGLPLAAKLSNFYNIYGFDKNKKRILELKKKVDKNKEIKKIELKNLKKKNLFYKERDIINLNCNYFIVTVPTPVNSFNKPDLRIIINATHLLSKIIKAGDTIIYESTVYPGLTEEVCVPILEKNSKLKYAQNNKSKKKGFSIGYSPERINPGDKLHQVKDITKVISASNSIALKEIRKIYSKLNNGKIFEAKNIRTAEAAKIIENVQRDINIALINELTIIFNKLNISIHDVLDAASTKWNFHKYYPGLVGGHCIGVDPYYLTYKSKKIGINPRVILSGRKTNDFMSKYFASNIKMLLNRRIKKNKFNILIMGFAFKENVSDIRNTKVFDLYKQLKSKKYFVDIYDPIVDSKEVKNFYNLNLVDKPNYKKYDSIIFTLSHKKFLKLNLNKIKKLNNIVIFQIKKIFNNNIDFTF